MIHISRLTVVTIQFPDHPMPKFELFTHTWREWHDTGKTICRLYLLRCIIHFIEKFSSCIVSWCPFKEILLASLFTLVSFIILLEIDLNTEIRGEFTAKLPEIIIQPTSITDFSPPLDYHWRIYFGDSDVCLCFFQVREILHAKRFNI